MDPQSEIRYLFNKLESWKDDSQREFSNIMNFHKSTIKKGINELANEVSDLQEKLSVTKKERNDLFEDVGDLQQRISVITKERNGLINWVDHLSCEIRKLRAKYPIEEQLQGPKDFISHEIENHLNDSIFHELADEYAVNEEAGEINHLKSHDENVKVETEVDIAGENVEVALEDDLDTLEEITKVEADAELKGEHVEDPIEKCFEDNQGRIKAKQSQDNRKNSVHKVFKRFKCDLCDYSSDYSSNVNKHKKMIHDKKRLKCEDCEYTTTRYGSLKKHMAHVHNKEKTGKRKSRWQVSSRNHSQR